MVSLSCSFVADLPSLNETQLVKLHTWIQKSCISGDVHLNPDGTMKLVCTRSKAVDKRQHQRTLRTNLQNWGVELENRQTDWLRLVDLVDESVAEEETPQDSGVRELKVIRDEKRASGPAHTQSLLQLPKNLLYNGGERFAALNPSIAAH